MRAGGVSGDAEWGMQDGDAVGTSSAGRGVRDEDFKMGVWQGMRDAG